MTNILAAAAMMIVSVTGALIEAHTVGYGYEVVSTNRVGALVGTNVFGWGYYGAVLTNQTDWIIGTNTGWSVSAANVAEIRLAAGGRMSSPVESVRVVTNVTHWNNEERAPFQFSWVIGEPQPGSVTKEATEQTETTEIVEVKTLRFTWDGEDYTAKRERVLSRTVRRWARKDTWVEDEQ